MILQNVVSYKLLKTEPSSKIGVYWSNINLKNVCYESSYNAKRKE